MAMIGSNFGLKRLHLLSIDIYVFYALAKYFIFTNSVTHTGESNTILNMHRLYSLIIAAFATIAAAGWRPHGSQHCLGEAEAAKIALHWLQIFQTDSNGNGTGGALIPSTIASNFTYYDEGASFGDPAPVYANRSALETSIAGSGYSGALVTDVHYTVLSTFASCDTVGLRWQSDSKSAKAANVTAPVGTAITYKGNDYLQVDLKTRLIHNVTSSSDLLNYYIQLGDDVIATRL